MRYIIIGLGNIGKKRLDLLKSDCVATVDPFNPEADFRSLDEVSPAEFDAAILSIPDEEKIELLQKLLSQGKHALVEKPLLFPDQETGISLQRLAEENSAIWYTSYNHRFEPLITRIAELIKQGTVGEIYHAHLLYGNGTVRNSMGSWREQGWGVLEDLGCHLIDLTQYLFANTAREFNLCSAQRLESKTIDHCVFSSSDHKLLLECASTMWKNRFHIDVYGELGSLHLKGLCKWGTSELQIHTRVFPSGRPEETIETVEGPDPTWKLDFDEFETRVDQNKTSFDNDLLISENIFKLAQQAAQLT